MSGFATSPRHDGKVDLIYPDCDGNPIAHNTTQFDCIANTFIGFQILFADRDDVFVAMDLLWYPVEGDPKTRTAPDVLVAFGRPPGHRGSYKQWEEDHHPLDVVFEIFSSGNTSAEMVKKHQFYERFGVKEYYVHDPMKGELTGWIREGSNLELVEEMVGWVSPLMKVRFELDGHAMQLFRSDGEPF